jgi:hypothetical protein
MEQNDFPTSDAQASSGGTNDTNTNTGNTGNESEAFTDRARNLAGNARERLADVGSTVKERASGMRDSVANALETGADKLRQRGQGGTDALAGATAGGSVALENDGRVTQVTDRVAGGMQATADFLRNADLDELRAGVERQVKEHPGRTLLIAVGLGYLLGKALRK